MTETSVALLERSATGASQPEPSIAAGAAAAAASAAVAAAAEPTPAGDKVPAKKANAILGPLPALADSHSTDAAQLQALERLERLRWPSGQARCPNCREGFVDGIKRTPLPASGGNTGNTPTTVNLEQIQSVDLDAPSAPARPLAQRWYCNVCRRSFSVLLGGLLENTRLPLDLWTRAFDLFAATPYEFPTALHFKSGLGIKSTKTARRLLAVIASVPNDYASSGDELLRLALSTPTDKRREFYGGLFEEEEIEMPLGPEQTRQEANAALVGAANRLVRLGLHFLDRTEYALEEPPQPNAIEHMDYVIRAGRLAMMCCRLVHIESGRAKQLLRERLAEGALPSAAATSDRAGALDPAAAAPRSGSDAPPTFRGNAHAADARAKSAAAAVSRLAAASGAGAGGSQRAAADLGRSSNRSLNHGAGAASPAR